MKTENENRLIDTELLAKLITAIAIAGKSVSAYPAGHPIVGEAFKKVIAMYDNFISFSGEITIGITSDSLLINGEVIETSHQIIKNFAKSLFDKGIAVLSLKPGLSNEELNNFIKLLAMKRDILKESGGIETLWNSFNFSSLSIKSVNYQLLSIDESSDKKSRESKRDSVWEDFARGLVAGKLSQHGFVSDEQLDPEIVAMICNEELSNDINKEHQKGIIDSITSFIRDAAEVGDKNYSTSNINRLSRFAEKLNPLMRREFLNLSASFESDKSSKFTENVISNISSKALIECMEDISDENELLSSSLLGIIAKISRHGDIENRLQQKVEEHEKLYEKMKVVLKEHDAEEYVPEDYQKKLSALITEDSFSEMKFDDLNLEMESATSDAVERNISKILIYLLTIGSVSVEERETLVSNLTDAYRYDIQTGNYADPLKALDVLNDQSIPLEVRLYLKKEYSKREILDEILSGLNNWGKSRFTEIREFISKIGSPFIEPLLDKLATEESLSLRRFLIDELIAFKDEAKTAVLSRLSDERWFVVRNLIVILMENPDDSLNSYLKPLAEHQNIKVREIAIDALIKLGDKNVEQKIIEELHSGDHQDLVAAIHHASKSESKMIGERLIELLKKHSGFSDAEVEIQIAILHAVHKNCYSLAIPEIAKILSANSIFHASNLKRLKSEVIKSLELYPYNLSIPLLEMIAKNNSELAPLAVKTLNVVMGKNKR